MNFRDIWEEMPNCVIEERNNVNVRKLVGLLGVKSEYNCIFSLLFTIFEIFSEEYAIFLISVILDQKILKDYLRYK